MWKLICYFLLILPVTSDANDILNIKRIENYSNKDVQRHLKPQNLGYFHNTIMAQVHDRILHERLEVYDEYIALMIEELSVLCDKTDQVCNQSLIESIVQSESEVKEYFKGKDSFQLQSILPADFDLSIALGFERIYNSVPIIESHDLDAFHDELGYILKSSENVNTTEVQKVAMHSLVSIAKESSIFWKEIQKNPKSAINEGRRAQQDFSDFQIIDAVRADILGGIICASNDLIFMILLPGLGLLFVLVAFLKGALIYSLLALGLMVV